MVSHMILHILILAFVILVTLYLITDHHGTKPAPLIEIIITVVLSILAAGVLILFFTIAVYCASFSDLYPHTTEVFENTEIVETVSKPAGRHGSKDYIYVKTGDDIVSIYVQDAIKTKLKNNGRITVTKTTVKLLYGETESRYTIDKNLE